MKNIFLFLLAVLTLASCATRTPVPGKNLFILSGQSNMLLLNPKDTFIPAITAAFGKDNVIVIKDAQGRQPIQRWYKGAIATKDDESAVSGDLYDRLMGKVFNAIRNERIKTVTFIWMQGENDAYLRRGDSYASNLAGVIKQLQTDLKRDDINVVIGRLSDFDLHNHVFKDWTKVRSAQETLATKRACTLWVDTDDLNDGIDRKGITVHNDLHYTPEGLKILGNRFADDAIRLINHQVPNCK